jgi:modification methylase
MTKLASDSFETTHRVLFENANKIPLENNSVDLVITSPPYPMIEMWDDIFINQNPVIHEKLINNDGNNAFREMHKVLNEIWMEIARLVKEGGFVCINIGDATRKIGDNFQLYSNQTEIISFFINHGFSCLPPIIWRKQSNKPNKFMGSGMLPAGAYVTHEHEYILIFRKGKIRIFDPESKVIRQKSAIFWEERNIWYSDIWDKLKGISQNLLNKDTRKRSAAFPFELAYRLINMYSIQGDIILDPFLGTGTSVLAAIASGRNSIGIEIDNSLEKVIFKRIEDEILQLNSINKNRMDKHIQFCKNRSNEKDIKYKSLLYEFPVVTRQEINISFPFVENYKLSNNVITCIHTYTHPDKINVSMNRFFD